MSDLNFGNERLVSAEWCKEICWKTLLTLVVLYTSIIAADLGVQGVNWMSALAELSTSDIDFTAMEIPIAGLTES